MKSVQPIATWLFFISRLISAIYFSMAAISAIAILFATSFLRVDADGKNFNILFPFTQATIVRGENNSFYITEMLLIMSLYGLFFWMLGNVLRSFRKTPLFTQENVKHFTLFYRGNLLVPLIFLVFHLVIGYEFETTAFLALLHGVLGTFTFFMTAIFKQGIHLQKEQELFI